MSTLTGSPAKLKDGSWGARIKSAEVKAGDAVTITTAAGKTWQATVKHVLGVYDGVALCSTKSLPQPSYDTMRPKAAYADNSGRRCKGCRGPIKHAPHHRAMGGFCGSCAFDEFDS